MTITAKPPGSDIKVSVIIPAYNAASTLAETLRSLQEQTFPDWEAFVINDGSSDATEEIASQFVELDQRIRLINQANSGVCISRNVGIGLATFDWLIFLDGDDWLAPTYLQRMVEVLSADASLDAVHCGVIYVNPEGTLSEPKYGEALPDLFPIFARKCVFNIHACIIRKNLVETVGGFDPSFQILGDWDLWQRVARTGAKFGFIKEPLAYYRQQPKSLSRKKHFNYFLDAMRLITQGHSADPRVPSPHPHYREGMPQEGLAKVKLDVASWIAGITISQGEDARLLLNQLDEVNISDINHHSISYGLFQSVPLHACQLPSAWPKLWPRFQENIYNFLEAFEARSQSHCLANRTRVLLERLILQHTELTDPVTIGKTYGIRLEVTDPIPDIQPPKGVDRLFITVLLEGVELGNLELPVIDGLVSGWVLKDALAAQFAWKILGRFFEYTIYADDPGQGRKDHDKIGWNIFLQELWGRPDWFSHRHDTPAGTLISPARECNSRQLDIEISEELADIKTTYGEITIGFTAGGVPLGAVTIPVKNNLLLASTLRSAITKDSGYELCVACVREALIGTSLKDATSLRSRLAAKALPRNQQSKLCSKELFTAQTLILGRRFGHPGTSVSRRALLPRETVPEIIEMAQTAGEPVVQVPTNGAEQETIIYSPDKFGDLLKQGPPRCSNAPTTNQPPWVKLGKLLLSQPFLIRYILFILKHITRKRHKQVLPEDLSFFINLQEFLRNKTDKLPILMYHRISPYSSPALRHYTVTPEAFEEHLEYLRVAGFYSVSLEDWQKAMNFRRPLPGKAIAITFDGGYQDFFEYGYPLLKKYGFNATVFLVADLIGKTNRFDEAYGEKVPLMGWREIRQLQQEGIFFGSHSASHPPLTALVPAEIVQEGARARALLQRELRVPINTFAYPEGDFDSVVQHLIGACGYTIGLTTQMGLSQLTDNPLSLSRLEITGSDRLQDFVSKLDYK